MPFSLSGTFLGQFLPCVSGILLVPDLLEMATKPSRYDEEDRNSGDGFGFESCPYYLLAEGLIIFSFMTSVSSSVKRE